MQSSKASAPSGGNESSNSSNEDKREKLELYLKDFDMRGLNFEWLDNTQFLKAVDTFGNYSK